MSPLLNIVLNLDDDLGEYCHITRAQRKNIKGLCKTKHSNAVIALSYIIYYTTVQFYKSLVKFIYFILV